MIKLLVEDYCHDCPMFEPSCDKYVLRAGFDTDIYEYNIRCENVGVCKNIREFFNNRKKEK